MERAAEKPYKAFISYSHAADGKLAPALQSALHAFAKPWNRRRAIRVFRDTTNLSTSPDLWSSIEKAIGESEFLLLMASPEAVRSPWVPREIDAFLRASPPEKILIVLTDGEVTWDDKVGDFDWARTTAFPNLGRKIFRAEPLYLDLRWARKEEHLSLRNSAFRDAVADLSSALRGISKDELTGQDVLEYRKGVRFRRSIMTALALAVVGLGITTFYALQKRNESLQRLARSYVESGTRRMGEDDLLGALPWFVQALEVEAGNSHRETMHRTRIGAVLSQAPKLSQVWSSEKPVWSAGFSPDGRRVLIVSGDVPDLVEAGLYGEQEGGRSDKRSAEGMVRIYDAASGRAVTDFLRHEGAISVAQFSRDGRHVLTAGFDRTVRLWDATLGRPVATGPMRHPEPVIHAEFSPKGDRLLTVCDSLEGGVRDPIRVWDPGTGRLVASPPGVTGTAYARFAPDGRTVAILDEKGLRLWSLASGKLTGLPGLKLEAEGKRVLAFSPNGRRLAVAVQLAAFVVDARTGRAITPLLEHDAPVGSVSFSPDGTRLLTASGEVTEAGSFDGAARVWRADSGAPVTPWIRHEQSVTHARFSPDGRWIVVASDDGTARVWNAALPEYEDENEAALARWPALSSLPPLPHGGSVRDAAFSPDSREVLRILTVSADREVRLWTISPNPARVVSDASRKDDDSEEAAPISAHSPDRRWIVAVEENDGGDPAGGGSAAAMREQSTLRIRDGRTRKPRGQPMKHAGAVSHVAFSPDGRRIVTAGSDGTAVIWDAQTGRRAVPQPLRHAELLTFAAFSPDSRRVVTASADNTARLWDVATGRPLGPPLQHERSTQGINLGVTSAAFRSDGRLLATAGSDNAVRLWDAATGEAIGPPVRAPAGHNLSDVSFDAEGRHIQARSTSVQPSLLIWDVPFETRPLDALQHYAQVASYHRLDEAGGYVPLDRGEFRRLWRKLSGAP